MPEDAGGGSAGSERDRPHLAERRDVPEVYQPAADSALLARTVASAVDPGDSALDVGTGSGYVAATMAKAGAAVVGVDLNPSACAQARAAGVPVVRGDLVEPFRDDAFDVVACNPPYLPTPPEREWDDWLERALSGGPDGRAMVDPFLASVGRVLAPEGRVYLLISTLTGVDAVTGDATEHGFEAATAATEAHPYEELVVLRLAPV
jgi:release factor glutamine methyltransferase